jgi:hypothetical protein
MTSQIPSVPDRSLAPLALLVGSDASRAASREALLSTGLLVAETATVAQVAGLYARLVPTVVVADPSTVGLLETLLPEQARVVTVSELFGAPRPVAAMSPAPVAPVVATAPSSLSELAALCQFTGDTLGLVIVEANTVDNLEGLLSRNVRDGDLVLPLDAGRFALAFMTASEETLRGIASRITSVVQTAAGTAPVRAGIGFGSADPDRLLRSAAEDLG